MLTVMAVPAKAQEKIDLESLLRVALGTNETIEQAKEEIQYAQLLRRAAWNAFVPAASLQTTVTRNDQEISFPFGEDDAGDPISISFQESWDYNANMVVGSPLYLGGRLYKTVEQSGINIGINELKLTQTQKDLMYNISLTYAMALKAQRVEQIRAEELALAIKQRDQTERFFNAGETVRANVLRAEAQVAAAEGAYIQAGNEYRKALESLRVFVALPEEVELESMATLIEPVGADSVLMEEAMENRTELFILDRQLDLNQLEIEKAFGEKLPEVSWNFIYTKQRADFPTDTFWKVNLNVTWRIWDSGASSIKKAQQETQRRQLLLSKQLLEKQIRADVKKARLDLLTVEKSLDAADRQLRAAQTAFEDMDRMYSVGEATDLDLQDARKQFINAQIAVSNLQTDRGIALIQLRYAMGLSPLMLAGGDSHVE